MPGRIVHVTGVVRPYVPGQTVLVKAFVGRKRFKTDHLRVRPAPGGTNGRFTEVLSSPSAGQVTVQVGHTRTATMRRAARAGAASPRSTSTPASAHAARSWS